MVVTDPIADMLIRIKNGYLVKKDQVVVPYSKFAEQLAHILVKESYLKDLKVKAPVKSTGRQKSKFKSLELELKYDGKEPALTEIKRISKAGRRVYVGLKKIPRVKYGFGITIVSTSHGLMTDKEARKKKLGGELICQIW